MLLAAKICKDKNSSQHHSFGLLSNIVETDAKWWFYKDTAAVLQCFRDHFVMILSVQW